MNSSELALYLEAGFIDFNIETDERFLPKILTNNQQEQVKVLENLLFELEHCDEFFFSVAFVTNSGIACLIDTLKELENKHIKGKILASQYQNFTEPRALRRLLQFPNLELKIITSDYNFHAKGYLFHTHATSAKDENYTMIVGSSNLTQSALTVNREWNVQLSSMKDGALIRQMQEELNQAWDDATPVTEEWIAAYERIYGEARSQRQRAYTKIHKLYKINPNKMQAVALQNIAALRAEGKNRALLISATGTGKTYLSAFDVRAAQPKRCLFIVHRGLIARKSKESFEQIIDEHITTGLFTSGHREIDRDYVFATVQTLVKDENLHAFAPDAFDYIIIDEAHHAGAKSYQKVLSYFKPKFLLGMTATPERSDDCDIFKTFDHNIAYEIRLHQALAENMLVPFHYHGVSEIVVDGELLDDNADFVRLTSEERVKNILYYADFYGCDQGRVKGIVFCSRIKEAKALSEAFNQHGKRSAFLAGATSEEERARLIKRLESDEEGVDKLDYLFSVDVLNEGVDIPSVNQIIMLRPTQSAIVFVQQLGRGLRKSKAKRYLEVIDFIGNYENNYMLPIALYGDRSCSKEKLRRIVHNNFLPGASTVYFTDVVRERIFDSLNKNNFLELRKLKESYQLVKSKLGHAPMMLDFLALGDKDPYLFIQKKKSYYNFRQYADHYESTLSATHGRLLEFICLELANGRRLEEVALLRYLMQNTQIDVPAFMQYMQDKYQLTTSAATVASVVNVLSMQFFKTADAQKYGNMPLVNANADSICLSEKFSSMLANKEFYGYVNDTLAYAEKRFLFDYKPAKFYHGLNLYGSYTRKDVCRILNWAKDESAVVYGYRVKYNTCPIFVTYKKYENISESTKYDDRFASPTIFNWQTRSRVNIDSPEVVAIEQPETLKLLFIKKSDAEGSEFYFMGEMLHKQSIGTTITGNKGEKLSIVQMFYEMKTPVEAKIYDYFEG